jgi:hypothetical protein
VEEIAYRRNFSWLWAEMSLRRGDIYRVKLLFLSLMGHY